MEELYNLILSSDFYKKYFNTIKRYIDTSIYSKDSNIPLEVLRSGNVLVADNNVIKIDLNNSLSADLLEIGKCTGEARMVICITTEGDNLLIFGFERAVLDTIAGQIPRPYYDVLLGEDINDTYLNKGYIMPNMSFGGR